MTPSSFRAERWTSFSPAFRRSTTFSLRRKVCCVAVIGYAEKPLTSGPFLPLVNGVHAGRLSNGTRSRSRAACGYCHTLPGGFSGSCSVTRSSACFSNSADGLLNWFDNMATNCRSRSEMDRLTSLRSWGIFKTHDLRKSVLLIVSRNVTQRSAFHDNEMA